MKNNTILFALLYLGVFAIVVLSVKYRLLEEKTGRNKTIDMPEEMGIAKQGDTLTVYKVTQDTVFVGFANKRNN